MRPISLCPASWASADALAQRRQLVEDQLCSNSHIPYKVLGKRSFECLTFYDGLWTDEAALRLVQGAAAADAREEVGSTKERAG